MLLLALGLSLGSSVWWVNHALTLNAELVDLTVDKGTSAYGVANAVSAAGVKVNPLLLYAWFRLSGHSRQIKAGSYEIVPGATPRSLLRKLVNGEQALRSVTLVEGWNFRQLRLALLKSDRLQPDTQHWSASQLMEKLGRPGQHPEGRFFPDSYSYAKGTSDLLIYQRALQAMDLQLKAAWEQRSATSPLKSPEQALILASIIEKETGRPQDRSRIAAVFSNRLQLGMPLQTDPSVIYGMAERFDGNLRKRDLQTDTPWNTYTRGGLPPTPIAMPGKASLQAAVRPETSKALYFVARGDGSSEFSETLQAHNRAVNTYQRKK
ncbi:MAG: endolytic transglycosylase MltG [Burkholderiaceae bacterium]